MHVVTAHGCGWIRRAAPIWRRCCVASTARYSSTVPFEGTYVRTLLHRRRDNQTGSVTIRGAWTTT